MIESNARERRWLLFLMQLPTRPAAPRIKLWRRLQQIGSVALKGSVYVLPDTPAAREDFEWLRSEVIAAGGQSSILAARALAADEEQAIVKAFQDARTEDFTKLAQSVRQVLGRIGRAPAARQAAMKELRAAERELLRLDAIDFGGSPARADAVAAVAALAERLEGKAVSTSTATAAPLRAADYQKRTWVTRPRPGVDRMSSAWLIRRFVDAAATFQFVTEPPPSSSRAIPFDMFNVEFGHHGDRCSFEVLAARFGIDDAAVRRIGEIVHDVDLKEDRYGHPEAAVVGALVEGLRRAHADDRELLEHGIAVFGGLYESFSAARIEPHRARARSKKTRPRRPR